LLRLTYSVSIKCKKMNQHIQAINKILDRSNQIKTISALNIIF